MFNRAQLYAEFKMEQQRKAAGFVRAVEVKGRQQGMSTHAASRFFHKTYCYPHMPCTILAHRKDSADHLFSMPKNFYKFLPYALKTSLVKDSGSEMVFENGSSYMVATAGSGEVGRGMTPRLFHGSEVAYWENAGNIVAGLMLGIPEAENTEIILESTARAPGDFFHTKAMQALANMNEDGTLIDPRKFQLIFVPWFWQEEYKRFIHTLPPDQRDIRLTEEEQDLFVKYKDSGMTIESLLWRREKLNEFLIVGDEASSKTRFNREFPNCLEDAFRVSDSGFFDAEEVDRAIARFKNMTAAGVDTQGALVIGVDPGRTGDPTNIAIRQGRRIKEIIKYPGNMDEMRLAGIIGKLIDRLKPDKVFIDVGNGYGTIDRLKELGYKRIVRGVHFNESALESKVYRNKRTEMHGEMRRWLAADGEIPPDANLITQLYNLPAEKENSAGGGKYLIPKEDFKKLIGNVSPNELDSCILTFAYPVKSRVARNAQTDRDIRQQRKRRKSGAQYETGQEKFLNRNRMR
jgi:hypothetical protein